MTIGLCFPEPVDSKLYDRDSCVKIGAVLFQIYRHTVVFHAQRNNMTAFAMYQYLGQHLSVRSLKCLDRYSPKQVDKRRELLVTPIAEKLNKPFVMVDARGEAGEQHLKVLAQVFRKPFYQRPLLPPLMSELPSGKKPRNNWGSNNRSNCTEELSPASELVILDHPQNGSLNAPLPFRQICNGRTGYHPYGKGRKEGPPSYIKIKNSPPLPTPVHAALLSAESIRRNIPLRCTL